MFLIDGHNLIGRLLGPGLDREQEGRALLVRRLGAWASGRGDRVVVVFDGNRPGAAHGSRVGALHVVYSPAARTADEVILERLDRQGGRGATVVTSDRGLAAGVRSRGGRVESAEAFAARVVRRAPPVSPGPEPDPEVEYWLAVFQEGGGSHKM